MRSCKGSPHRCAVHTYTPSLVHMLNFAGVSDDWVGDEEMSMRLKSSSMTVEVARSSIFWDRVLTSSSPPAAAEGSEGLPMYSHSCERNECIVKYTVGRILL